MPVRPLAPMLASAAAELPRGDDWTYELTFDGYRVVAVKDGQRVTLYSRNLKDLRAAYPSVVTAVRSVPHSLALDGEIIAFDREGRPSFQTLHHQLPDATVQ
jgi:bifunctional non-homologous end joining protein LigD